MNASFLTAMLAVLAIGPLAQASTSKTVTLGITTEPPNLNTMKATDQVSFFVIGHVIEGLTRYGKNGEIIPGVAEKWSIDDQGATFNLRKNVKWSDGSPLTAQDFVFAWRMAVDPKTASEYAFILFPVKNAEAISQGKMDKEMLGVQAPDPHTLKVTFEKPCGYFLSLTAFSTYSPAREEFYENKKDRYAADVGDMLFNGPYVITKWVHGAALTMEKNPNYWNKAKIGVEKIDIPYITPDTSALFNFFKDRKTDILGGLSKDDLPRAQAEKFKMRNFGDGSIFFMEFNFREGRASANLSLRKAIAAVFNPQEYVQKVVGIPGTKPGVSLIPSWVRGTKDAFRKEYPIKMPKPNLAEAKKHLAQALKELKLSSPPSLIWLTGDTPTSAREAEYFQNIFKTALGIDLKIDKQIFKQRLAKMTAGEFDIVSAGWGPDYPDPMTFADLMTSWNENNRGKYKNDKVDELIRKAQATSVPKQRMDFMAQAEKISLDELAILPLFERTVIYVHHDRLQGVVRHPIGPDPDFTFATVK